MNGGNSIYQVQALSDIAHNYLKTIYGEYLIVDNQTSYDLDMLSKVLKNGKYVSKFRLFSLYPDERINFEIPQEDIINNSGNYTENYQNGQRRNLNISLVNKDGKYTPNINTIWVQDKFRLDVGIEFNGEIFWFPRGIYIMGNPNSEHQDSDKKVDLCLVDKFALLEGKMGTLETTYEIPEGSDIEQAIIGILTIDTGSGYSLDLKPIIYDHSFKGKRTPYTLRKDPGSTFGEMILELADMLKSLDTEYVINIPSKKGIDNWCGLLEKSGFEHFATYSHYLNLAVPDMKKRPTSTGAFAKLDELQQIYDLLYRSFTTYASHLPSKEELREMISNNRMFVDHDNNGNVCGVNIFTITGTNAYGNAWVDEGERGLDIFIDMFNLFIDKGVKRFTFWVNDRNNKVIKMHKIMGAKPDGLKDYTYIKHKK